jgi:dolichol-phosphate mannosyltransferase
VQNVKLAENSFSIIIPTYNESENMQDILSRIKSALPQDQYDFEILMVDDNSSDKTADIAENALGNCGRVIRRKAVRSLSLSVLDGINQSSNDLVVVMDADGSHPPELIPEMIKAINQGHDLIVASRYVAHAGSSGFPLSRKLVSRFACFIGNLVCPIRDNTSGFFCIKKESLNGVILTPRGFKIGLEVFAKAKYQSYKEIPYIFVNRIKGKSKLGIGAIFDYLVQVLRLLGDRK